MRIWFSIKSILVSGTASASGSASPLNLSINFGFFRSQLSKVRFFLFSHLIPFFGGFIELGNGAEIAGKAHLVGWDEGGGSLACSIATSIAFLFPG